MPTRHLSSLLKRPRDSRLPLRLPFHVCVCCLLALCETQGNSKGSASRVSNTRSAQWGIYWEQWCWQWKVIMDLSDKFANCLTSNLRALRAVVCWPACCTLCEEQSEWRTDFPEWCFRCCWEEGRADRQPSLSLINKPQRWSGEMPLFDKQEGHCLRISTGVVEWSERGDVRRVTDTVAWMEDVLWRCSVVLHSVRFGPVCHWHTLKEASKVFLGC